MNAECGNCTHYEPTHDDYPDWGLLPLGHEGANRKPGGLCHITKNAIPVPEDHRCDSYSLFDEDMQGWIDAANKAPGAWAIAIGMIPFAEMMAKKTQSFLNQAYPETRS